MAKCPYCSELIDDDSCYCDQCGGLLYVCPKCKKIGRGKGKRCGACGSPLVSTVEQVTQDPIQHSGASSNQSIQTPPPYNPSNSNSYGMNSGNSNFGDNAYGNQSQQNNMGQSSQQGNRYGQQRSGDTTYPRMHPVALEFAPMCIRLNLVSGNIIGRTTGPYSPQLSQCIYISGTHARVDFDGRNWTITDLGSRNGTRVNGVKCTPTQPFKVGDIVRLGNFYDFKVV